MIKNYFQDELEYLRELGHEFAARHPDAAAELALTGRDPEIGRLLQGAALLTARVRQDMDPSYPELRHPILERLWPPAVRSTPAFGILELRPTPGRCRAVLPLRRGAMIESIPVEGTACRFRTCYDISLFPLRVDDVMIEAPDSRGERLRLLLRILPGGSLQGIRETPLRLHLHGPGDEAHQLYLALCRRLTSLTVEARNADGKLLFSRSSGPSGLRPVGWEEDQTLLPYPSGSLRGLRHLLEYFLLDRKYLFLDVTGLEGLDGIRDVQTLQITMELARSRPDLPRLVATREHIRLHCVPIVNLFPHPARSLSPDTARAEYLLQPDTEALHHCDIYSIESVRGYTRSREQVVPILPEYAVSRPGKSLEEGPLIYRLRRQPAVRRPRVEAGSLSAFSDVDHYISFEGPAGASRSRLSLVTVELLLSNGALPRRLGAGDLRVPTTDIPPSVTLRELGPLTPPLPAPTLQLKGWPYLTHPGFDWTALTEPSALRHLLLQYDPPALFEEEARSRLERMIEAIAHVSSTPEETILGAPPSSVFGTHLALRLQGADPLSAGRWFLFGAALFRFMVETAPSDAWVGLTVEQGEQGQELVWPSEMGRRPLL